VFLGRWRDNDLYHCAKGPTVIARYGSEGSHYTSGLATAWKVPPSHPLNMARRLAQLGGLNVQADLYGPKAPEWTMAAANRIMDRMEGPGRITSDEIRNIIAGCVPTEAR
jgi:hypothetical protein